MVYYNLKSPRRATTVLFLVERNKRWCYSFIAYRCRTLKLCCSYAVCKTVSRIARPRVRGRLFRAATTSPYFWPMGGGRPPGPPMPGSANDAKYLRLLPSSTPCGPEVLHGARHPRQLFSARRFLDIKNYFSVISAT